MHDFLGHHSGELLILILFGTLVATLMVLVPQLLRAHLRKSEMQHAEHMRAIEQGQTPPEVNESARLAGRTAMLVPMVVICAASTVTCFLIAYRSENIVAVALAVWCVSGIVSLAAITGGVALMGRLAQLQSNESEEEMPDNPLAG
ncbi:MAG: hypothetical protein L0Z62_15910 [Gemmataceae bacterium]|nr:hypothetical protein [Gemmataceae bacterium]